MHYEANGLRTTTIHSVAFSSAELDLMYELARRARNSLGSSETPEPGSKAAAIIALDDMLTTLFYKRRR